MKFMQEQLETRVGPETVWRAWESAHFAQGESKIEEGKKGKFKFHYQVFNVKEGEAFSILFKAHLVRLVFHHSVKKTKKGSLVTYQVEIKGWLAPLVRWMIQKKLQRNISHVLKSFVQQLEHHH